MSTSCLPVIVLGVRLLLRLVGASLNQSTNVSKGAKSIAGKKVTAAKCKKL